MISAARMVLYLVGGAVALVVGYILITVARYYSRVRGDAGLRALPSVWPHQWLMTLFVRMACTGLNLNVVITDEVAGVGSYGADGDSDGGGDANATGTKSARQRRPFVLAGPYFDYSPLVLVSDPDALAPLFRDEATFRKHPADTSLLEHLVPDALLVSRGALWKRQRRLLTPLFHGRRLKSYLPTINDEARALCVRIAARNGVASSPVDDFNTVTLRVAVRSVLGEGLEPAELMANFKAAVAAVIAVMGMAMFVPPHVVTKYFAFVPFVRRFNTSVRELRASVARLIAVRREHLARGGADDDQRSGDDERARPNFGHFH
mmetsp:Transcript_26284/g.63915  ORF Transcript_26284/g.63915 Transcript_26284/m.63915 type:complete len:320 (+) Transcript_26284:173-1132(+)